MTYDGWPLLARVDVIVAVMAALEEQLALVESELRPFARTDHR